MDKDTLRAIKIINEILENLTIVVGCEDIYNLLRWKNRITTKRQDLENIIKDNEERLRSKKLKEKYEKS